jgi:hypothetical protein
MNYGFDISSAAAATVSAPKIPQVISNALRNFGCSIASQITPARTMKAIGMCMRFCSFDSRTEHSAPAEVIL